MVAPRTDPGRGAEDKQPRDTVAPPSAPTPDSGWQGWMPLGIAIIAMPVLAYFTTTLVLVPKMQKALAGPAFAGAPQSPRSETKSDSKNEAVMPAGTKQSATLNKLLVNVAGTMGSRYLLTSITLISDVADFSVHVTEREPQLRDMASGILSTKTIADLEKPGARNLVRGELLAGFNTILGKSAVGEIYFTEFAIQ